MTQTHSLLTDRLFDFPIGAISTVPRAYGFERSVSNRNTTRLPVESVISAMRDSVGSTAIVPEPLRMTWTMTGIQGMAGTASDKTGENVDSEDEVVVVTFRRSDEALSMLGDEWKVFWAALDQGERFSLAPLLYGPPAPLTLFANPTTEEVCAKRFLT